MTEIKTIAYDTAKELCIKPTSHIYVPVEDYDNYEGVLKFILSKWMEAEWKNCDE